MKLFSIKLLGLLFFSTVFFSANVFAADNAFSGIVSSLGSLSGSSGSQTQPTSKGSQNHTDTKEADDKKAAKSFFEKATYEEFEPQVEEALFDENLLGTSSSQSSVNSATIDAGAITLLQSTFLKNLHTAFSSIAAYAMRLLSLFAVLELAFFGLIWALQRDVGWDKLFFKVIKIGLIFFIIQNYTWLLDTIMHSFARLAGVIIDNNDIAKYVFNPAKIWEYGYNSGVNLLQLSTTSGNNFGLAMIQVSLGMGILLVFGLIGIQMIMQMTGFYLVSLGALILLPIGSFALGRGMFDKAVQAVLQAGIRLMSLIVVIGVAVIVWSGFDLAETTVNINQPLGLFFTALLVLCLAYYLPKILSSAIGSFSHDFLDGASSSTPVVVQTPGGFIAVDRGEASDMRAATVIEGPSAATISGYAGSSGEVGAAAAAPVSINIAPTGGSVEAKMARETLAQASVLSKSISENTVKKIKETVMQAAKEKK